MSYMTLQYEFADSAYAELTGSSIKFWVSLGLPDYEGSVEGFAKEFPEHFQHLLDKKIVKPT